MQKMSRKCTFNSFIDQVLKGKKNSMICFSRLKHEDYYFEQQITELQINSLCFTVMNILQP